METITYITLPKQTFDNLVNDLQEIKQAVLSKADVSVPKKEWLSRKEFMSLCGIRTTKLYQLMHTGQLTTRKIGRRMYIHKDSVDRYFNNK